MSTPDSTDTGITPTVHSRLSLSEHHNVQFVTFKQGVSGVIQTGRAVEDYPATVDEDYPPPEAGETRGGEYSESKSAEVRSNAEQVWFRETFCNGAQACVQGWDWALHVSSRKVGNGTGIVLVGSEGTVNATFFIDYWDCFCTTPFCIGGPECHWLRHWHGLVLPGHWLSAELNANNHYLRWRLEGAGGGTQVSLAARY
jgi:hypothetical protein